MFVSSYRMILYVLSICTRGKAAGLSALREDETSFFHLFHFVSSHTRGARFQKKGKIDYRVALRHTNQSLRLAASSIFIVSTARVLQRTGGFHPKAVRTLHPMLRGSETKPTSMSEGSSRSTHDALPFRRKDFRPGCSSSRLLAERNRPSHW